MFTSVVNKLTLLLSFLLAFLFADAQRRRTPTPASLPTVTSGPPSQPIIPTFGMNRGGPRPYKDIITSKAHTMKGLFAVHKVDEKWYLEIGDTMLGRQILIVNRLSKAGAGMRNDFQGYAGDIIGNNVIQFEKGPANRIFVKKISFDEMSRDSSQSMYTAVTNSNIQPIVAAFDITAYAKDSSGILIDITSYLNTDNDILNFAPNAKSAFQVGGLQPDKSYVANIKSYPMNVEIKTVKTYSKAGGGFSVAPFSSPSSAGQLLTMEINSSILLLPVKPMRSRIYDSRVGYFTRSYTDFDANPQGVKEVRMIVKWRLEPKAEDIEKYKRGELVEPQKQIVYYIDPATPKKWVPYLIQGVNDWQVAFEKAGFKNAIVAKLAPTLREDSTWSLEDARYSAIVYKPSNIANASGPNVHDPRTGEILESHINWYHNVMELLRNWYFIQAAAVDPRARTVKFDDSLMGQLIRFVSSHEVGHTLGLRHNFGSSSTVPVESLRNKAWVEANGHTPSIMDYARFNYVAQPEDKISDKGLYPRIGDYDKWAIEWGYRLFPDLKTPEEEVPVLNKLTIAKLKDRRLFFGTETNADDPHSQNEDLGDDAMKASEYGIKNLKRIVPNLVEWTKVENEDYKNLSDLFSQVVQQYGRYMGHVAKNIGGIYETPKTVEQPGGIYEYVPEATQRSAMQFLGKNLFTTPKWLINDTITMRTGSNMMNIISTRQEAILNQLTSNNTFSKLIRAEASIGSRAYSLTEVIEDLKKNIWSEVYTHKPVDVYRRNLQKAFVERLGSIINPGGGSGAGGMIVFSFGPSFDARKSDVVSVLKGNLRSLKADINNALPSISDTMTRYHLEDVEERIEYILNPR